MSKKHRPQRENPIEVKPDDEIKRLDRLFAKIGRERRRPEAVESLVSADNDQTHTYPLLES